MKDSIIRAVFRNLVGRRGRRLLVAYQDGLLRKQILYAATNSPFYVRRFKELGLDPHDVRTSEDLSGLGFFTYPKDIQADPYDFLAVPRPEIVYAMSSSGTTGTPKVVFLTQRDWQILVRTVSNALALMGVTASDVVQIVFYYGSLAWMTGPVLHSGLERLGAFVLPSGSSAPTHKQIEIIRQFGTTIILGTPSYLHRLTEEGRRLVDLRTLGVRIIRLGAEPWTEDLRAYLQEAWGAQVYDAYGMMELGAAGASECHALSGLHLSPYLLVEVINPNTGEPLPRGQVGELVYTALNRQASPLLRYRSGDLGRLMPSDPCPCATLPTDRIDRIVGRTDDMMFLGSGENAFPSQFEQALMGIEGLTGFQIVIEKAGYQDRLRVRVEALATSAHLEQAIRQRLYERLPFLQHEIKQSQMIAPLDIELLEPGTLHAESPAKIRPVVDTRTLQA